MLLEEAIQLATCLQLQTVLQFEAAYEPVDNDLRTSV